MTVRQILGSLGEWSVTLKPETPRSIRLAPVKRDHVVITPGYVADRNPTAAALFAQARYTGRIIDIGDRLTFSGDSVLGWIGDGDSPPRGPLSYYPGLLTDTFATYLSHYLPANGITIGTGYSSPAAGAVRRASGLESLRSALDRMALDVDAEYRVNHDGTLDYGAPGSLWKSGAAIDTILTLDPAGNEPGLNGLQVARFDVKESGARAVSGAQINHNTGAYDPAGPSLGYGFDGVTAADVHYVETFNGDAAAAAVRWSQVIAQRSDTQTVTAEIVTPDIGRYMTRGMPGDWLYVFDPETGLADYTNPGPVYRGQPTYPLESLRIVEADWPVSSNFGLFHIASNGGTNAVTDWTPYVAYETGTTMLTLAQLAPLSIRKAVNGDAIP